MTRPSLRQKFVDITNILTLPDVYTNDNFGDPNSVYSLLLGNDTVKCYDCVDQNYYNREYPQTVQNFLYVLNVSLFSPI